MQRIRIEIHKKERTLRVYEGENLIKTFAVVLGFAPAGDKAVEGDGKTPEGRFYVFTKNPESKFHLSLGISYPSIEDAERGVKENLISKEESDSIKKAINEKAKPLQKTKLGGEIYIHGGGTDGDWTDGCIALNNNEIAELFELVPVGAVVDIRP
ncbi:MAG: murein L,D-transpeptidase family protein [Pyrinomonadaceae bacterium]